MVRARGGSVVQGTERAWRFVGIESNSPAEYVNMKPESMEASTSIETPAAMSCTLTLV